MDDRFVDAIWRACQGADGLEAALLFGSAARGVPAPRDVDVAFLWSEDVLPFERLRRAEGLASSIARELGAPSVPIDAHDLRSMPLPLQDRVLREQKRAYVASAKALIRFQARIVSRALDELPSYRRLLALAAEGAVRGRS